ASRKLAPDPTRNYERSHPELEAGMGRMDNNQSTPTNSPDQMEQTVRHRQDPTRQINAEDVVNAAGGQVTPARAAPASPTTKPPQPDHSMLEEEPTDWDLAPQGIKDKRYRRHPRTEGKGGTA